MKGKKNVTRKSLSREDLVQEMIRLFAELQELSRYQLLANLSLDHFSQKEQRLPNSLRKMSLEELSQHVGSETFAKTRLSVSSLEGLKEILSNLVQNGSADSDDIESPDLIAVEDFPADPLTTSHEAGPTELVLQGLIDSLRASPGLTKYEHRRLGEFWEADWPRAPFEETFTLRQLSRLEAYVLLKKRSVTDKKAQYIHLAIQKALELCADQELASKEEGGRVYQEEVPPRQRASRKQILANHLKTVQGEKSNALYGDALYYLTSQLSTNEVEVSAATILQMIQEQVNAEDLEFLIASYRYRAVSLANLCDSTEEAIEARLASCGAALRAVCSQEVPHICTLFEAFEIVPLVAFDKVASLCAPDLPQPLARLVTRSILSAFGYRELSYRTKRAPELAIRRGGMLEVKLDAVSAGVEDEAALAQVITLLDGEALEIFQELLR